MSKPNLPPETITLDREYKLRFTWNTLRKIRKEFKEFGGGDIDKAMTEHPEGPEFAIATVIAFGICTEEPESKITPEDILNRLDVRQLPEVTDMVKRALGDVGSDISDPTKPQLT